MESARPAARGMFLPSRLATPGYRPLERLLRHPFRDVIGLANSEGDDRQSWIRSRARTKRTAVAHEQVIDVVRLTPTIRDTGIGI